MRASSGLRAGKRAEGTPSETDLSAAGRCADRILGHLLWAFRYRRGTLGPEPWRATLAGHPKHQHQHQHQHRHHQHHHLSTPRLPLTQAQLPGLWADVIIVVFRAENRSLSQNGLSLQ